jgi:hypothetical protein
MPEDKRDAMVASGAQVDNGRITDDWRIKDKLALLQEMSVAKVGS